MINFYNQVPSVYTSISRDFQYLSWLINIVLNSVKHNVDDLYDLPNTKADPRLTELLAMTLGFKVKRKYDQKQLAALVSIIPSLLKYKGSTEAIVMAAKTLLKVSGANGDFHEEDDCKLEGGTLVVRLPKELVDTTLFMDLLPYILPAGITCRIVRQTRTVLSNVPPIDVRYQDTLYANWHTDLAWNEGDQEPTGITRMFDVNNDTPIFTNYRQPVVTDEHGNPVNINVGLLDNTIIPVLDTVLVDEKTKPAAAKDEENNT